LRSTETGMGEYFKVTLMLIMDTPTIKDAIEGYLALSLIPVFLAYR